MTTCVSAWLQTDRRPELSGPAIRRMTPLGLPTVPVWVSSAMNHHTHDESDESTPTGASARADGRRPEPARPGDARLLSTLDKL